MTTKKTELQASDFAVLLSAYNLKSFLQARPFESGSVQTNVKIESSQGSFVLRYYENRSVEWVTYETSLIRFLVEKGYPTPTVIADKKGRSFGIYREHPFALFEYIEGVHPADPNSAIDPAQRDCVARAIARMHVLTHKLVLPFESVREGRDVDSCYRAGAAMVRKAPAETFSQGGEHLAWLKEALAGVNLPDTLPRGVCHGDCGYTNFLFRDGELSGVLDLDMSCHAPFVTDLASLIYWWAWAPEKELDVQAARAIVLAYGEIRPVTRQEQNYLFDALRLLVLFSLAWGIGEVGAFEDVQRRLGQLDALSRDGFTNLVVAGIAA